PTRSLYFCKAVKRSSTSVLNWAVFALTRNVFHARAAQSVPNAIVITPITTKSFLMPLNKQVGYQKTPFSTLVLHWKFLMTVPILATRRPRTRPRNQFRRQPLRFRP